MDHLLVQLLLVGFAIGLACFFVWGGFWCIGKLTPGIFQRVAQVVFAVFVLVVIMFALIYLVQHFHGGSAHAPDFVGW